RIDVYPVKINGARRPALLAKFDINLLSLLPAQWAAFMQGQLNTPKVLSVWSGYKEFLGTKKNMSRGYVKTLNTLENRLRDFEKWKGQRISFEWILGNTQDLQFQLEDYFWNDRVLSNGYVNKLLKND
ncbi:MAG: hypothetical protein IIB05_09410, partial [Bacteroidetes bacterium]|nr:hypothetical protein [Bacteroidota bacterium]